MNVAKTKELVLDARTTNAFVPVKVNNEPVEVMSNFKYFGTLIHNQLSLSDNTVEKNSQQRFYLLCKQRSFDVSHELLQTVYKNLLESILTFNLVVWYGNLGVKKAKLAPILGMAGKIPAQSKTP